MTEAELRAALDAAATPLVEELEVALIQAKAVRFALASGNVDILALGTVRTKINRAARHVEAMTSGITAHQRGERLKEGGKS